MIQPDMIPEEKCPAVIRGLREAFGVTEFEDIRRITKGRTSALVFRIVVGGAPFLLRIIMRPNALIGPERHFFCMRTAAEAGLAPRVRYASLEDQISITDFVKESPFPEKDARVRMPALLRALHALPPFPRLVNNDFNTTCTFLLHEGPGLHSFLEKFQAANLLAESKELLALRARLASVYLHQDADLVSSHNDLFKPDNILFDGNRVWIVDWEAAFLNDRYADLAAVANLLVTSDAEERTFLQAYFGPPPDEYQMARFFLMQQIAHLFYAMAFLWIGAEGRTLNQHEKAPEFDDFRRRFWTGEVELVDRDAKLAFGRMHLNRLQYNIRQTRFETAARIVSDGPPRL
jgi:aminoglycoside phosphotransferase (APT) family kinase protein